MITSLKGFWLGTLRFINELDFFSSMAEARYDEYGTKLVNESGDITFMCPNCNDAEISRSKKARELSKSYTCPKCGFVGPWN